MNWADILERAGIPEPPGRVELVAALAAERAQRLIDHPNGVPKVKPPAKRAARKRSGQTGGSRKRKGAAG